MRILLPLLFVVSCSAEFYGQTNEDEQAVQKQIEAMLNSWNQHDFSDMKNYTTKDVDWVNIVGMWWKGRDEVQYAHDAFHKTMFRNTNMELVKTNIRFITEDVAVAHIITRYGEYTTPDGIKMGNTEDIATLVYVRRNGEWMLTAGENVTINESAKPHDPVKHMTRG